MSSYTICRTCGQKCAGTDSYLEALQKELAEVKKEKDRLKNAAEKVKHPQQAS